MTEYYTFEGGSAGYTPAFSTDNLPDALDAIMRLIDEAQELADDKAAYRLKLALGNVGIAKGWEIAKGGLSADTR